MLPTDNISIKQRALKLARETWLTSWELIRITVPVAIATKILDEFGLISILSKLLEPVMELVGLPGSLGLVWATAMFTNIYGGIAVFSTLAPGLELTAAQVTVLCSVILIAHSLPIELSVSTRAGAGFWPIAALRLGGAMLYGSLLNLFCLHFGLWQEEATLLLQVDSGDDSLWLWAFNLLENLALIIAVIFLIIIFMRVLRITGILGLLERLLTPVLPVFGMGTQAAPITVVGMIMGIGYGGALIIREATTGKMTRDEVFCSMALMGLCHGLVEDTLLMAAIGGKFGGILWGRMLFSLVVIFLLVRFLRWYGRRLRARTTV